MSCKHVISIFKEGDRFVWIPVANGKSGGPARAFLPFNGLAGTYRYGYKAAPSTDSYFNALSKVQQSFLENEHQVFAVNSGKKEEKQFRARWRHGNETGASLLGPTMGWVRVPVDQLDKLTGSDLEKALRAGKEKFAEIPAANLEPVLCYSRDILEYETSKLLRATTLGKPAGQAAPERQPISTEQFVRDAAVVAYVLRDAQGHCECCMQPAPFTKLSGLPYLEIHHVKRLASGGSDKISNAVAVCPNCHRELHYGSNYVELANSLYSKISRLERE